VRNLEVVSIFVVEKEGRKVVFVFDLVLEAKEALICARSCDLCNVRLFLFYFMVFEV
jgi:hypothetical protein